MCARWIFICLLLSPSVYAAHCNIDVQPVAFGSYDIFYPGPLDSVSYVNLQCSSDEAFRVVMSSGINGDGSFEIRRMQSATGTSNLIYNLYLDASRQQVWGDGTGGSLFHSGTPIGGRAQIPVYGRVPPGQRVETGLYRDAVLVTVEF